MVTEPNDDYLPHFEQLFSRYVQARGSAPLSESALVSMAIDFANGAAPKNWRSLWLGVDIGDRHHEKGLLSAFADEQSWFRSALREIAAGNAPDDIEPLAKSARRMLILPRFITGKRSLRVVHWYLPDDLMAVLSYVVLLLLDADKGYGADLCQCELSRCGVFFLAIRGETGRPRRKYCTQEHLEEAHEADAAQRVRDSRANRAKARKAK